MPFSITDWNDWTPTEYEVGAPATSLHFERWFRNAVALAQGSAGAPRIVGAALDTHIGGFLLVSATPLTLTDLDRHKTIVMDAMHTGIGSSALLYVEYSNNNGSSFATSQYLGSYPFLSYTKLRFDLVTGLFKAFRARTATVDGGVESLTLTVPANVNAMRISTSQNVELDIYCFGGVP